MCEIVILGKLAVFTPTFLLAWYEEFHNQTEINVNDVSLVFFLFFTYVPKNEFMLQYTLLILAA